nr:hypothetical protein [Tanacetum cinerariifolium]
GPGLPAQYPQSGPGRSPARRVRRWPARPAGGQCFCFLPALALGPESLFAQPAAAALRSLPAPRRHRGPARCAAAPVAGPGAASHSALAAARLFFGCRSRPLGKPAVECALAQRSGKHSAIRPAGDRSTGAGPASLPDGLFEPPPKRCATLAPGG